MVYRISDSTHSYESQGTWPKSEMDSTNTDKSKKQTIIDNHTPVHSSQVMDVQKKIGN